MDFANLERIVSDERAIIYVRDDEGRYVWVNAKYLADLPVDKDRIIGRTNREIYGDQAARGWEIADSLATATNTFVITPEELYDRPRRKWRKFLSTKVMIGIGEQRYLAGISIELVDDDAVRYEKKLAEFRARLIEQFGTR